MSNKHNQNQNVSNPAAITNRPPQQQQLPQQQPQQQQPQQQQPQQQQPAPQQAGLKEIPAFDPECLLEKDACPVCQGRSTVHNLVWTKWREAMKAWNEQMKAISEENEARQAQNADLVSRGLQPTAEMLTVPRKPSPPFDQEERICDACDGMGRQLSAVGKRMVDILRPYLKPGKPKLAHIAAPETKAG